MSKRETLVERILKRSLKRFTSDRRSKEVRYQIIDRIKELRKRV